jgi:hypothetical protein
MEERQSSMCIFKAQQWSKSFLVERVLPENKTNYSSWFWLAKYHKVQDIKRAPGSAFPCIFSDDFRPTIRKAAPALH